MAQVNKISSFKSFTEIKNQETTMKLREENNAKRQETVGKIGAILDEMGLTSFGEVVAQIERTGFIPPKRIDYEKDDIDMMLLYYTQWAQHFTNSAVDTEPNENWREQVDLSEDLFMVDELSNIEDAEKDYAVEAIDEALEEISKLYIVEDAYDGEE